MSGESGGVNPVPRWRGPRSFMIIAGEASGDLLGAELGRALRHELAREPYPPVFFGAGGPQMAAAGMELTCDLTRHSVIGLFDALKKYRQIKRIFDRLFA